MSYSFKPENFLILVVDDVNQNLQVVGAILDEVGYATTFATSGEQAIKRVATAQPDLILLDLMMPSMNGLEVCQILKSQEINQDIPIIFLTASNEKEHLIQAFSEGAVDYVTKPFSVPELLARVRTHLELKYTREQLKLALQKLEKIAITDPLTTIYNRRQLFILGSQELERCQFKKSSFSVLLIDIDNLQSINHYYGYEIGDQALIFLVNTALKYLGNPELLCRFSGQSFLAILPETTLEQAQEIAEIIRESVAKSFLIIEEQKLFITVSIGVSSYFSDCDNFNKIINLVEQALGRAKKQGGNNVSLPLDK